MRDSESRGRGSKDKLLVKLETMRVYEVVPAVQGQRKLGETRVQLVAVAEVSPSWEGRVAVRVPEGVLAGAVMLIVSEMVAEFFF